MRIIHVINPYDHKSNSKIKKIHDITIESINRAKQLASINSLDVEVCTVGYSTDPTIDGFTRLQNLSRTFAAAVGISTPYNLPIFKDILDIAARYSNPDDIIIYTNIDIILLPNFYILVAGLAKFNESFTITRRTVSQDYLRLDNALDLVIADIGKKHPGFDCFVFTKSVYDKCDIGTTCIGAGHMEVPLILELARHSKAFEIYSNLHATCHIGDDRPWINYFELNKANLLEAERIFISEDNSKVSRSIISLIASKLPEARINVNKSKVAYTPKTELSGHTVILPYYSDDEYARFVKIAKYIKEYTFHVTKCKYNFLVVPCNGQKPNELMNVLNSIAPAVVYESKINSSQYSVGSCGLFWDTMEYINSNYDDNYFALWLESDMLPVKPNWVDMLNAEWESDKVVGMLMDDSYSHGTRILIPKHINGGAMYPKNLVDLVPQEARTHPFDLQMFPYICDKYKASKLFKFVYSGNIEACLADNDIAVIHAYVSKESKGLLIDDTIDRCIRIFNSSILPNKSTICCSFSRKFPNGIIECPIHGE